MDLKINFFMALVCFHTRLKDAFQQLHLLNYRLGDMRDTAEAKTFKHTASYISHDAPRPFNTKKTENKKKKQIHVVVLWKSLPHCSHLFPLQVYNEIYFQVTLDDLSVDVKPRFVVCHASAPGILPVQWCLKNGVCLERPRGYEGQDFDWADYLKHSGTEAAPDACFPDVSFSLLPN